MLAGWALGPLPLVSQNGTESIRLQRKALVQNKNLNLTTHCRSMPLTSRHPQLGCGLYSRHSAAAANLTKKRYWYEVPVTVARFTTSSLHQLRNSLAASKIQPPKVHFESSGLCLCNLSLWRWLCFAFPLTPSSLALGLRVLVCTSTCPVA